jgi:LysR family cys regulon transcriptional activator
MAADCADRKDLQVIDAEGLFPRSTTWIGYRKDAVMRRYMIEFLQLFAPHVTNGQMEDLRRAGDQESIDELFGQTELPLRSGCEQAAVAAV